MPRLRTQEVPLLRPLPVGLALAVLVPVVVRDRRASGTVLVPLPQLPDDAAEAGPDEVVEWQQVLVRELCG